MSDDERVQVTLSKSTVEAALNCLSACADDEREPQRYRDWYYEAHDELTAAVSGDQEGTSG